jgi:uncharacterized membrane protein YgcG
MKGKLLYAIYAMVVVLATTTASAPGARLSGGSSTSSWGSSYSGGSGWSSGGSHK